jgi:hypothetical protein
MRGPLERRRVSSIVAELGELPPCIGHYQTGHPECEGPPRKGQPCTWRGACRCYQETCKLRGVDPEVEKGLLSHKSLIRFVIAIMHTMPSDRSPTQLRAMRAWDRFQAALQDALPGVPLHVRREAAMPGELYVHTWAMAGNRVRAKLVRLCVDLSGQRDVVLCRYWPQFTSKVLPTIDLRAPVRQVLGAYPVALAMATRWRNGSPGGPYHNLGCSAVGVHPERIEDVARLLARLLADGHMAGLALANGYIKGNGYKLDKGAQRGKGRRK